MSYINPLLWYVRCYIRCYVRCSADDIYLSSTLHFSFCTMYRNCLFITARKRSLRRLCFYRCLSVHGGGGVCGCSWGVGACMVAAEGVGWGVLGSMCGCSGGCMVAHRGGGMCGCSWGGVHGHSWGACVVALGGACVVAPGGACVVAPGDMHGEGGHAWQRGACVAKERRVW